MIEIRLFNTLARYAPAPGARFTLHLPEAATDADALARVDVPRARIFRTLAQWPEPRGGVGFDAVIEDWQALVSGDVLAFSGPVPYSTAYGTPVC